MERVGVSVFFVVIGVNVIVVVDRGGVVLYERRVDDVGVSKEERVKEIKEER